MVGIVVGVPEGLHLADVREADWLVQQLARWGGQVRVGALLPAGFDAYLRVLPPAVSDTGRRWRGPVITAASGVPLTGATRYNHIAGAGPTVNSPPQPWDVPPDGILPEPELAVLAEVLARFTDTPAQAYFCVWNGWGAPWVRALEDLPDQVQAENRAYHLLTGPVAAATAFRGLSASLWWPADRAWVVATEIDGYSTYLGGGAAAVGAVHGDPRLDSVPVELDTPIDLSPWDPPHPS